MSTKHNVFIAYVLLITMVYTVDRLIYIYIYLQWIKEKMNESDLPSLLFHFFELSEKLTEKQKHKIISCKQR